MTTRPVAVTVISWIQIAMLIMGSIGLVITFALLGNPMMQQFMAMNHAPIALQLAMSTASILIKLICVIGFLRRWNWARFVFVVWNILALVYIFLITAITPWVLIPGFILPAATVLIIFLPNANRYFSGKNTVASTTSGSN